MKYMKNSEIQSQFDSVFLNEKAILASELRHHLLYLDVLV